MKTILKWFFLLAIGVGIGILLYQDPGYVLFSYSGWVLEMPLLLAGFLMLLLMIGFYFLIRTGHFIFNLPHRVKSWFSRRKQHLAWLKTIRGLKVFLAGDYPKAESLLSQSNHKPSTTLCYLVCAHAAAAQGAIERRDHYLQLAHFTEPKDELVTGITQATLQFSHKQYEQSLATILRLRKIAPHHPSVLKLQKEVYMALKDEKQLLTLLPVLSKHGVISTSEQDTLRRQMYGELFDHALHQKELETAQNLWQSLSTSDKQDPTLQGVYAKVLFYFPPHIFLENFIRHTLFKQWNVELIPLYGQLEGAPVAKQLSAAEGWLEEHPRDSELLLCLGRLCLKNQLWGKAKRYLETSIQIFPTPIAYYELACLNEILKEETHRDHFKQGLTLVVNHAKTGKPYYA